MQVSNNHFEQKLCELFGVRSKTVSDSDLLSVIERVYERLSIKKPIIKPIPTKGKDRIIYLAKYYGFFQNIYTNDNDDIGDYDPILAYLAEAIRLFEFSIYDELSKLEPKERVKVTTEIDELHGEIIENKNYIP